MKKILSVVLAAIMLLSISVVATTAAGTVIFEDNFDMGFKPANWIQDGNSCAFKWDGPNQCIIGYEDAVVLQTNFTTRDAKKWDKFYSSYDFQIRGFDDLIEERESHSVGMWYRANFENEENTGAVYMFWIEIETGKATFNKSHTFNYRDENGILQTDGRIDKVLGETIVPGVAAEIPEGETALEVGDNAPFYEMGMRVTDGKIECYFEQQLVFAFEADPNDEKLGEFALNSIDASVGAEKSPILFWNQGNYVAVDNFRVMTPNYDFIDSIPGDVDGNAKVNIADASLLLKKIAGWEVTIDESAADANGDDKINIADVSLLLKYIAGWEVTLGPQA